MLLQRQTALPFILCAALILAGCTSIGRSLPTSGPTKNEVRAGTVQPPAEAGIVLVDLSAEIVRRSVEASRRPLFSDSFGNARVAPGFTIGPGDVLEVAIWEAPPAALFGTAPIDTRGLAGGSSRMATLPEQLVNDSGTINMPFAGSITAAGRTTQQVEEEIARRLKSKANDPQVMVRVVRNVSSTVTVVGEVVNSSRVPLTPRGERLLDVLAAAGGTRQPVGKVTVQITREVEENGRRVPRVQALPLDNIITDPAQNIQLQAGDVVTVLFQPNSLMLLGATSKNEELNFEAQGITLAQSLARAGGLSDYRADIEGVFIFRFEDPRLVGVQRPERTTVDGLIPVIYRVNLRDPATFFMAQGFPMRNKDILYVSNAPAAELQKFLNIVGSVLSPINTVRTFGQ